MQSTNIYLHLIEFSSLCLRLLISSTDLNGVDNRRKPPSILVGERPRQFPGEPARDPGQQVDVAVVAHGVQEVVALVVGQVPNQRRLQSLERGALKCPITIVKQFASSLLLFLEILPISR